MYKIYNHSQFIFLIYCFSSFPQYFFVKVRCRDETSRFFCCLSTCLEVHGTGGRAADFAIFAALYDEEP